MEKENLSFNNFFDLNEPKISTEYIRIMNYNILAPNLLFSSVRLPEEILDLNEIYQWTYRSKLIIDTKYSLGLGNIEIKYGYKENIKSNTKYFSSKKEINGCYLKGNDIYYYDEKVMSRDNIFIAGMHNVENCMAAIMVVKEFGVSNEIINKVISDFRGVEHRLEYVDTVNGVRFYNDTEATNIKCTQIALSSFDQPITIILGGLERGQDFNELTPFMNNVSNIIAIGQCRDRVVEFGKSLNIPTYSFEFLKDGFDKCVEVTNSGGIILLSPASASWDQYKECEIRGAEFKKKVEELKNEN